jgi:metal-responsive CopG/Arc/MetJ family transcriptional regulator
MEKEKSERINFTLDEVLYKKIWDTLNSFPRNAFASKSEFIRKLIKIGLENVNKEENQDNK